MKLDFSNFMDKLIERNIKKAEKMIIIHTWFAWHPVKISDYRWVWLVLVLREYRSNNVWNMSAFGRRYKSPLYYELEDKLE